MAAPVPLLVVRLVGLERIAWRQGRAAARAVERRSLRSFVATASRTLRSSDLLVHDAESEDFIAALTSPRRKEGAVAAATDCRATLARLAGAMELEDGMAVVTGWTVVHGVAHDRRLEGAVESALERGAREQERYAFFCTVGHELRTPLTSIRGYLETLLEEPLDQQTTRRFLEVARAESARLGRLVDGMFELSLLDLRTAPGTVECSSLGAAIGAAIAAVAPQATARRTTLANGVTGTLDVAIGADRLTQVLVNVLENAVKHGRERGTIRVSRERLDTRYVEVRVDDDGSGVAPEEREAVFSLARRGSNARAPGTGLGLAVVRLMLERIGGEVDVTASPLGGARFRLRLPLAQLTPAGPSAG